MRGIFSLAVVLSISLLSFFILQNLSAAWWNQSFTNRINITITSLTPSVLTDYQVPLNITYNINMSRRFEDLRFVGTDDLTPLPYWIEQIAQNNSVLAWVRIPTVPTNITRTFVMVYFHNDSVQTSLSCIQCTFQIGDDFSGTFNSSKWNNVRINATNNNGVLDIWDPGSNNDENFTRSTETWSNASWFEGYMRWNVDSGGGNFFRVGFGNNSGNGQVMDEMSFAYFTGCNLSCSRERNGTNTAAKPGTSLSINQGIWWRFKILSMQGDNEPIRMYVWQNGTSEPSSPQIGADVLSFFHFNKVFMSCHGNAGSFENCQYDDARVRKFGGADPIGSFGGVEIFVTPPPPTADIFCLDNHTLAVNNHINSTLSPSGWFNFTTYTVCGYICDSKGFNGAACVDSQTQAFTATFILVGILMIIGSIVVIKLK